MQLEKKDGIVLDNDKLKKILEDVQKIDIQKVLLEVSKTHEILQPQELLQQKDGILIGGQILTQSEMIKDYIWNSQETDKFIIKTISKQLKIIYKSNDIENLLLQFFHNSVKQYLFDLDLPVEKILVQNDLLFNNQNKEEFKTSNQDSLIYDNDSSLDSIDQNSDSEEENKYNIKDKLEVFKIQQEDQLYKQLQKSLYAFVWHDQNLDNYENQAYYKQLLDLKLNISVYDKIQNAVNYIITNSEQTFILITSGANGENFVKQVHHLGNVRSIIVYCMNVQLHSQWAKNYNKIQKVTNAPIYLKQFLAQEDKNSKQTIRKEQVLLQQNIQFLNLSLQEWLQQNKQSDVDVHKIIEQNKKEESEFFSESTLDYARELPIQKCLRKILSQNDNDQQLSSSDLKHLSKMFNSNKFFLMIQHFMTLKPKHKSSFLTLLNSHLTFPQKRSQNLLMALKISFQLSLAMQKQIDLHHEQITCYKAILLPLYMIEYLTNQQNKVMVFRGFEQCSFVKQSLIRETKEQKEYKAGESVVVLFQIQSNLLRFGLSLVVLPDMQEALFGPLSYFQIKSSALEDNSLLIIDLVHLGTYQPVHELQYACSI
eukprot:403351039